MKVVIYSMLLFIIHLVFTISGGQRNVSVLDTRKNIGQIYSIPDENHSGLIIGGYEHGHSTVAVPFTMDDYKDIDDIRIGNIVEFRFEKKIENGCVSYSYVDKIQESQYSEANTAQYRFDVGHWPINFFHHDKDSEGGHKTGVINTIYDDEDYYLTNTNQSGGDQKRHAYKINIKYSDTDSIDLWFPKYVKGDSLYHDYVGGHKITGFVKIGHNVYQTAEQYPVAYNVSFCHFHHDDSPDPSDIDECLER